eukprot:765499-Hanusia_phi.AAC.6
MLNTCLVNFFFSCPVLTCSHSSLAAFLSFSPAPPLLLSSSSLLPASSPLPFLCPSSPLLLPSPPLLLCVGKYWAMICKKPVRGGVLQKDIWGVEGGGSKWKSSRRLHALGRLLQRCWAPAGLLSSPVCSSHNLLAPAAETKSPGRVRVEDGGREQEGFRREARLRYATLNQSEPLRILLFALLTVFSASASALAEALDSSLSDSETLTSLAVSAVSFLLFLRERGRRTAQLVRFDRESGAADLSASFEDPLTGARRSVKLRDLRDKLRVLVVYGDAETLRKVLKEAAVYRRRILQSQVLLVLPCLLSHLLKVALIAASSDGSSRKDWELTLTRRVRAGVGDILQRHPRGEEGTRKSLPLLSSPLLSSPLLSSPLLALASELEQASAVGGAWFALNKKGRSYFAASSPSLTSSLRSRASGLGAPRFDELLGSRLPPTEVARAVRARRAVLHGVGRVRGGSSEKILRCEGEGGGAVGGGGGGDDDDADDGDDDDGDDDGGGDDDDGGGGGGGGDADDGDDDDGGGGGGGDDDDDDGGGGGGGGGGGDADDVDDDDGDDDDDDGGGGGDDDDGGGGDDGNDDGDGDDDDDD